MHSGRQHWKELHGDAFRALGTSPCLVELRLLGLPLPARVLASLRDGIQAAFPKLSRLEFCCGRGDAPAEVVAAEVVRLGKDRAYAVSRSGLSVLVHHVD